MNSGFAENETLSGEELQLHASALLLFSFDLTAGTAVPSRAGRDLRVSALPPGNGSARSETTGIDDSAVVEWDIAAANGVIHAPAAGTAYCVKRRRRDGQFGYLQADLREDEDAEEEERSRGKAEPRADRARPQRRLVAIPNPLYGGHASDYEPLHDALLQDPAGPGDLQ